MKTVDTLTPQDLRKLHGLRDRALVQQDNDTIRKVDQVLAVVALRAVRGLRASLPRGRRSHA